MLHQCQFDSAASLGQGHFQCQPVWKQLHPTSAREVKKRSTNSLKVMNMDIVRSPELPASCQPVSRIPARSSVAVCLTPLNFSDACTAVKHFSGIALFSTHCSGQPNHVQRSPPKRRRHRQSVEDIGDHVRNVIRHTHTTCVFLVQEDASHTSCSQSQNQLLTVSLPSRKS